LTIDLPDDGAMSIPDKLQIYDADEASIRANKGDDEMSPLDRETCDTKLSFITEEDLGNEPDRKLS
jgi:hypothetical protein